MISFLSPAKRAAQCADDKKAEKILLLDIRRFSSVADFCVLATVDSPALMRALEDHIGSTLEDDFGLRTIRQEGKTSAQWLVMDFGGLVVHLMHPQARNFYGLERLWEDAKEIAWQPKAAPAAPKKTAKKTLVKSKKR
jgi:ribosome-associated protein